MGIFDILKGKHKDDIYHSGSREAQRYWVQYQKFQDAQNRVLGQPLGMPQHFQNLGRESGKLYNHRKASQGERADRHQGFNQIAASLTAGEAASLREQNPDKFDALHDNLYDMKNRLEHDFTPQNYAARHEAVKAEFAAHLPKAQAEKAAQDYANLMADKEQYGELLKALEVPNNSSNYNSSLSNPAIAAKLNDSFQRKKRENNRYLELRLGLKRESLGDSIVGDIGILAGNGNYYQNGYEKHAPFRDGSRDNQDFGNGSHLMMVGTTLDVLEGKEQVESQHAHKSMNEYFTARQQGMQRPRAGNQTNLDRAPDMGDRDR